MHYEVSIITTVLNEAESIEILLDSLARQTRQPDEVVIVDGGSTDGTLAKINGFAQAAEIPLKVLSLPGANISQGRNLAIAASHGSLIAATDAGVRLENDWLEQLLAPFAGNDPPDAVGGFFVSAPQSTFELALGATTLPSAEEIDRATFCPSSRSIIFRREVWQAVGGYPEWLDYCEDLLFDFALLDAGYTLGFAPRAIARFRPRPTLGAFFSQYYRYARGDGKADFWRYRHLIRYATYLLLLPLLLALSLWHSPFWLLALAGGGVAMVRTPMRRLLPKLSGLSPRECLAALAWVPIIRLTGDVAKMLGYPVGVWWRWHHAPERDWAKRQF